MFHSLVWLDPIPHRGKKGLGHGHRATCHPGIQFVDVNLRQPKGYRQSNTSELSTLAISIPTVLQLMTQDTYHSVHFSRFFHTLLKLKF